MPIRRLAKVSSKLEPQILQKTCLDYVISLAEYEKEIFKTYTVEVNILECPVDASDILLPYYDTQYYDLVTETETKYLSKEDFVSPSAI